MSDRENFAVPRGFGDHDAEAAVFLDIDGVLQEYGNGRRFDRIRDGSLERAYDELEEGFGTDYRKYDKYDVAAVYYDWNRLAVADLKRVLDASGAKIVLSSNWRSFGPAAMLDFFRIHGLDRYYVDDTAPFRGPDREELGPDREWKRLERLERELKLPPGDGLAQRTREILCYLAGHRRIKRYVALDDLELNPGLEGHFVKTSDWITAEEADAAIKILRKGGRRRR